MSVSLPEYKTPQVLNVDRATPDRSPSKSSKVKRTLKVNIMLNWREYEANDGKKQSEAEEIINLNAVADTGADVCCTSPKEALKMGFKPKQLLKHPICLQAANGQKLQVQGYLPVIIYVRDLNGEVSAMAREQLFIIVGCKSTILSRKALIDLGSISPNFPEVASVSVPVVHSSLQLSLKTDPDNVQTPEMSKVGSKENLTYEVNSVILSRSKDSFTSKKKKGSQKQKFKGAPATKMPITPKEVIDMKVGDITDSTNSVADGDSPGGGANSPVVVKPAALNYFLSRQVWRPWAD